jgi:hypothetical protein
LRGYDNLPEQIAQPLSWDSDLFADFTVCPFTSRKPGEMQLVCVDSATNFKKRPLKSGTGERTGESATAPRLGLIVAGR